jgi:hypothetical protein
MSPCVFPKAKGIVLASGLRAGTGCFSMNRGPPPEEKEIAMVYIPLRVRGRADQPNNQFGIGWHRGGSGFHRLFRVTVPAAVDQGADQFLVERCLGGQQVAWQNLADRLQERANHVLALALGQDAADQALVEAITVDLLSTLFLNKRALQAFLTSGKSLNTYLDLLLNRAAKHFYQERGRHKRRTVPLSDSLLAQLVAVNLPPGMEEELLTSLNAAEKRYYEWLCFPLAEGAPPCPFAQSYARKLRLRIVKKALQLLYGN